MSLRALVVSLVTVSALSSLACGGDPPEKELQQAESAITAARAAGADDYAGEELAAADAALKNANAAVEQHDYRLALNHALDSREHAEAAIKLAVDGKAAARAAADRALTAATAAVAAAEARVKSAESQRLAPRALNDARSELTEAQGHLQEARTAFAGSDYGGALKAASAATEALKPAIQVIEGLTPPAARRRSSPTR